VVNHSIASLALLYPDFEIQSTGPTRRRYRISHKPTGMCVYEIENLKMAKEYIEEIINSI